MATELPASLPQASCHLLWAVRMGSLKTLKAFETQEPQGGLFPSLVLGAPPAVVARTVNAPLLSVTNQEVCSQWRQTLGT